MNKTMRNSINKQHVLNEYTLGGNYIGNWKVELRSNKVSICPRMRKILDLQKGEYDELEQLFALLNAPHRAKLIYEFKLACFNGTRFEKQLQVITPQGNEKWIQLSGVLYSRRWGTAEQMVGTVEDVTQNVKEDCLSMAIVDHELRSPLTLIKLNTQFLINEFSHQINKRPLRLLTMVDEHINGMTKLIEEYLTTSSNEDRDMECNFSVFELGSVVNMVINEIKLLYPSYRFRKCPSEEAFLVRADKYKIVQVLINYLTNAAKFSPACSPILITIRKTDTDVTVSVKDEGPGIDEAEGPHIFQTFYQCSRKSIRQKNSKGLGLYIVKNIIQKHGGTVWAENAADSGAIFCFSLPLDQKVTFNYTVEEAAKLMA